MTEKYARFFERIVIGAAIFWGVSFAADITVPLLSDYLNPSRAGHGGGGIMIATPLCIAAIVIALVVCLKKSKKEKKQTQNGENNEHPE